MKTYYRPLALALLLTSPLTTHAAKLIVPETLVVTNINGEEQGYKLLARESTLNLKPGAHRIEIKYRELFEEDDGSNTTISSDPVMLGFNIDSDETYYIRIKRPLDSESAARFAKQPAFSIVDEQGKQLPHSQLTTEQQKSNWLATLGFTSQSGPIEPVADATNELATPVESSAQLSESQQMALDMLNYWWQKADSETRAAFKQAQLD